LSSGASFDAGESKMAPDIAGPSVMTADAIALPAGVLANTSA